MNEDLYNEILDDAAELVRREAAGRGGMLGLSPETAALYGGAAAPVAELPSTLEALADVVENCRACGLCEGRTRTVFADGSAQAQVVFVGEAPGENEDRTGVPFVGRAGQMLTDIIEKGMKLPRSEVYICNVIKCRPPGNRDPKPEEKAACEPYLVRQLELVRPKVIVALGKHAAQSLLRSDETIGRMRGRWHFYRGVPLRVTYHPAYLLRSPGVKGKAWADIQEVMKVLSGEFTPEP